MDQLFYLEPALKKARLGMVLSLFFSCALVLLQSRHEISLSSWNGLPLHRPASYPALAGILSFPEAPPYVSFPDIKSEVEVIAFEARPDSSEKGMKLALLLKKSREQKNLSLGQQFYLSFRDVQGKPALVFSEEPTPFWLESKEIGTESVGFQVGLDMKGIKTDLADQKEREFFQVATSFEGPADASDLAKNPSFKILSELKNWGLDLLSRMYHEEEAPKYRLEIDGSPILFLGMEDLLIFKEGKWSLAEKDSSTEGFPLAKIKAAAPKNLELEGWDEKGKSFLLTFPYLPGQPMKFHMDQVLLQPRLRTLKQISCQIEKDRLLLKTGDWLTYTGGKWQHLATALEKEELKNRIGEGDLFVFDALLQKNGKKILQGHLFNGARTSAQKVEIPIGAQKIKKESPVSKAAKAKMKSDQKASHKTPDMPAEIGETS